MLKLTQVMVHTETFHCSSLSHPCEKKNNANKSPTTEGKHVNSRERRKADHRDHTCSSYWISDDIPIAAGSADGTESQVFKTKHSYTTRQMRSPC